MAFTRNYKNILMASMIVDQVEGASTSSLPFDSTNVRVMKSVTGSLFQQTIFAAQSSKYYTPSNVGIVSTFASGVNSYINVGNYEASGSYKQQYINIVFGSNDTEETIDDFKMNTLITTISKNGSFSTTQVMQEDGSYKITYSGTITSTSSVTIKEFGLAKSINYTSSSGVWYPVLLFRKVLEEPIELTANVPTAVSFDVVIPNILPDY